MAGGGDTDGDTDGPVCDDSCQYVNDACLVDADCGAGYRCVLGICAEGCSSDADCDSELVCGAHGRCEDDAGEPVPQPGDGSQPEMPPDGGPELSSPETSVPSGGGTARVELTNTASIAMTYRVESASPAATYDSNPQLLGPGETIELELTVDVAELPNRQPVIPARILTNLGIVDWDVVVRDAPGGYYRGSLFLSEVQPLGTSSLAINLNIDDEGTITGQTFSDGSLLWPNDLAVQGTLGPGGDVEIHLIDVVPATFEEQPDWLTNPLQREVGREFVLWGDMDTKHGVIDGVVDEFVTGLAETAVLVQGTFRLDRAGELRGASGTAQSYDAQLVPVPEWDFAEDDGEACAQLGVDYGTQMSLAGLSLCVGNPSPATCVGEFVDACTACANDIESATCAEAEARECGRALLATGLSVSDVIQLGEIAIEVGGSPSPDATKAPMAWIECLDGVTPGSNDFPCVDQDVTGCAGALARRAMLQSDGRDPETARVFLDQLEGEAETSAMLGLGRMVEAGLAYAAPDPLSIGSAADAELTELRLAMDLFSRPLRVYDAPGFDRALQDLDEEEVTRDRDNRDLVNMLILAKHATEVLGVEFRLRQRTEIGAADTIGAAAQYAAAWIHAQGALFGHRMTVFGAVDAYGSLSVVDDAMARLARTVEEAEIGNNPLGFSRDYVPMLLSAAQPDTTNFEENWTKRSLRAVEDYEQMAAEAWQAQQDLQAQQFTAVQAFEAMEEDYDGQLVSLCGADPLDPSRPHLTNCGVDAGEIHDLRALIDVAVLHLQQAEAAINYNNGLIGVERSRIEQIALLHAETQTKIQGLQTQTLSVITDAAKQKSILRIGNAEAECARIAENAETDRAQAYTDSLAFAATGGGWPPNAAVIAAAGGQLAARNFAINVTTENACDSVKEEAELGSRMEWMDALATQQITMYNQEIDALLRESSFKQQVIDSEASVKSLALKMAELGLAVDEARLEIVRASSQVAGALQRTAFLLSARERARRRLQEDPQNPYLNPSFLVLRNELGRNLAAQREFALRRVYQAARSLEYETNRDLTAIEVDLFPARSPQELRAFHECLFDIYIDYVEDVGGPQQFVTEISLRSDVFGITDDAFDPVTGDSVSPAEQFREVLRSVENREDDGTIALRMALPLIGQTLIEPDRCDARVASVGVKVVGDFLGDDEISIQLRNDGVASMRRCDADALPFEDQIEVYNLGRSQSSIQAGANTFGSAEPNRGFAGWALSSDEWIVAIPPGTGSPANADLDLDSISDIVLKFEYKASTLLPGGEKAILPTCGF